MSGLKDNHHKMQCSSSLFQGGFYCGTCKIGWVGDAFYGCRPANFCASGENNCDEHADCIYTGPGEFKCIVSVVSIIGLVKMFDNDFFANNKVIITYTTSKFGDVK